LGEAVSREYAKWCENHPGSTQDDRKQAYRLIHDKLESNFPSFGEMKKDIWSTGPIWVPIKSRI
jgi:hypothetical protein